MRSLGLFAVIICGALTGCSTPRYTQLTGTENWAPDPKYGAHLKAQEAAGNGIGVGRPKFYDDASLRMMLDATRATLASMTGLDQGTLISALGNVSGATIEQTQFGLQVTGGGALPSVVTTNTGPTSSTTTNTGLPTGNTSLPQSSTVATTPTQSAVTTSPTPQVPPTVPSGLAFAPPAGVAPSSLDLLNQEMQLSGQMANFELLLEGAVSDRYVFNQRFIKPRVTIGFPVTLRTPAEFSNAVAVVEVTVQSSQPNLSGGKDGPSVTVLLPSENTYNVAAMTDHMTSIGAGAVIGTVGVAGSYLKGRKTLYLVQDQDTVAMPLPAQRDPNTTSFAWEFHPVLGERYVRSDMKQTFVQLTFPSLSDVDCYGTLQIRTYWRRFDQGTGHVGDVIPQSVLKSRTAYSIPRYDLTPQIRNIAYQDLGDGTLLVSVTGNFLNGTYVQVGGLRYDAGRNLQLDQYGLRFVVPASALAQWTGWLIARDGEPAPLVADGVEAALPALHQTECTDPKAIAAAYATAKKLTALRREQAAAPLAGGAPPQIGFRLMHVRARPIGEATTELNVWLRTMEVDPAFDDQILISVAGKVFGLRDAPVRRLRFSSDTLMMTAVVPTSLLLATPEVKVFRLFYFDTTTKRPSYWYATASMRSDFGIGADADNLTLLSTDTSGNTTYLLSGNDLINARVLLPTAGVTISALGHMRADQFQLITLTKSALTASKKIVLQKDDASRPFILDIPTAKPTAPAVSVDSPLIQNVQQTDIGVDKSADIADIKYKDKSLHWSVLDKSTLRLLSLRDDGVTDQQRTAHLTLLYKNGSKAPLTIEVVAARVGVQGSSGSAKAGSN